MMRASLQLFPVDPETGMPPIEPPAIADATPLEPQRCEALYHGVGAFGSLQCAREKGHATDHLAVRSDATDEEKIAAVATFTWPNLLTNPSGVRDYAIEDAIAKLRAPAPLRMLDLFSGSGSASRAAAVRGWDVVRVDNAPGSAHDILADLTTWRPHPNVYPHERFDLVWASPPCTQLSTVRAKGRNVEQGLVLVRAAIEIIRAVRPRWWALENVHGATVAIGNLIGPPVARYGSFYLWGVFPPFEADVPRDKMKKSGRRRAERRAAIPWAISDGLVRACEALATELDTKGKAR